MNVLLFRRAKFHKLKYGVDLPATGPPEDLQQFNSDPLLEDSILNNGDGSGPGTGVNWKHGRQLLRQYLQVQRSFFEFFRVSCSIVC